MNKKCKNCAWSKIDDAASYCSKIWAIGGDTCTRWAEMLGDMGNINECKRCKRNIDPGEKCWWCGDEN